MTKIDLHIHSNCSDGSDSIEELVEIIKGNNLGIFALTDHDTVSGCDIMAKLIPENIKFIKGVELTCITQGIKCHILGFGCDDKNEKLLSLIEKGKQLRRIKFETRVKYLKDELNIELTQEELDWLNSRNSVTKTHFANILVQRGLAEDPVSAMKKYLDNCKTQNANFDAKQAVEVLVEAGAIPVWAHPLGGEGEVHISFENFEKRLEHMISLGIKGLECYYSRYNEVEIVFLKKCAKKYNLLISGGSDYHGKNKKNITPAKLSVDDFQAKYSDLSVLKYLDV